MEFEPGPIMHTDDLDYALPEDRIAAVPADRREQAKLMVASCADNAVEHRRVADLPTLLRAGDLLVLNRTRVLPARFPGVRSGTGGKVEGLYLGSEAEGDWRVLLESRGKLQPGERIDLAEGEALELIERSADAVWRARRIGTTDAPVLLERIGAMPLPPYIRRRRADRIAGDWEALDRQRYQTVFADRPGAVAAPTAALHLTETLLGELADAKIETAMLTLHVGLGTFAPVRSEMLDAHPMHSEWFEVPADTLDALRRARAEGRRIIPVGTTCVRALESLPDPLPRDDYATETDLMIQPGFAFRYTDALMTNFHLPRSTLLALVAALTGLDRLKALYQRAIDHDYRFYSYGDAMLIFPESNGEILTG